LPTPRCGVPTDEGCNQPLSSGPKTHLNTMVFCFVLLYPICEESPQLGASRPYNLMFTKKHGSKAGMSNAHKTQNQSTTRTQVTTRAHNTTRRVLYSNGSLVRCGFISYFGAADRWRFRDVGAPDSPVPPSDRWLCHASRADYAADCWLTGQSGAHWTVR
jgi:hypothetical protein